MYPRCCLVEESNCGYGSTIVSFRKKLQNYKSAKFNRIGPTRPSFLSIGSLMVGNDASRKVQTVERSKLFQVKERDLKIFWGCFCPKSLQSKKSIHLYEAFKTEGSLDDDLVNLRFWGYD